MLKNEFRSGSTQVCLAGRRLDERLRRTGTHADTFLSSAPLAGSNFSSLLEIAQGLMLCAAFYWDLNERTRAFTKRLLKDQKPTSYPTMDHAGCYSGALHYLKAVAALGAARAKEDGAAVVAQMKAMPIDDDAFGQGTIRLDGRTLTPAYLFRVKSAEESKYPWDYYSLVKSLSPDEIWRPLSEGNCPLVRG